MRHDQPEGGGSSMHNVIAQAKVMLERAAARSPSDLRDFAKRLAADRRKRSRFFPIVSFGDPTWDMLLELYAHGEMAVTSACIASGAPPTTGLRHLVVLERQGMVERMDDERDGRRILVRLTEEATLAMESYLLSILASE